MAELKFVSETKALVTGRRGKYVVKLEASGFSWSHANVYAERQGWWFGKRLVEVWEGDAEHAVTAFKFGPDKKAKMFLKAVEDYEKYMDEWEKALS